MRVVVHPASLDIGGSPMNAVDLAVRLSRRGHDVRVFGPPGPLAARVTGAGVPFHAAPPVRRLRPSPASIRALRAVVREHGIEVVHAWEWPPIVDAVYGPGLLDGVAVVGTIMSMGVAPFLPRHVPLTVGTAAIAAHERTRRPDVALLEPPVDTDTDAPVTEAERHRRRAALGVGPDEFLLVVVSRLVPELKREGILDAVRATGALAAAGLPVRLVVAGDGVAGDEVRAAAAAVDAAAGREVVSCIGAVDDPSGCYAAADVVLGMGGSALRGMAFGKPLIVQGERGFWRLLTPDTLRTFLHTGWYGVGDGGDGAPVLAGLVRDLMADPASRESLGDYARELAVARFSLDAAAASVERLYAGAAPPGRTREGRRDLATSFAALGAYDLRRRIDRRRGRAAADDFNAVSAQPPSTAVAPPRVPREALR